MFESFLILAVCINGQMTTVACQKTSSAYYKQLNGDYYLTNWSREYTKDIPPQLVGPGAGVYLLLTNQAKIKLTDELFINPEPLKQMVFLQYSFE